MGTFQDTYKITAADKVGKGNVGLPDTPGLTTRGMQEQLDSLSNLSIDKFNAMVDAVKETLNDSDTELPTSGAVINYISGEGGAIIDDTTPSLHKAYSSQKVENMFGDVASRVIDDTEPLSNKTYSSEEIEEKLSNIPSPESIIDDDTASTDTTYSSSKLESDFISVSDTEEQTATDEFTTINGGLLSECKVALSPNQDLHGYENPWVGGASKNKLPLTVANLKANNTSGTWAGNEYTLHGITVEVLTDDSGNVTGIKAKNGTASANVTILIYENPPFIEGSSYTLNGTPATGSDSTYRVQYSNNVNQAYADYGNGATFTEWNHATYTERTVRLTFFSGYSIPSGGLIFYPMIRLATESDPTFEPYSNICPISGHTQVDVEDDGKNRIPYVEFGILNQTDGSEEANNDNKRTGFIYVPKHGNYTISGLDGSNISIRIFEYDKNKNYIRNYLSVTFTGALTIITNENVGYVRFQGNKNLFASDTAQFEEGSTATAYVPYNGYQITVNLGGTYYSGTLDVVTGVFTPDTASVDLGSLTWTRANTNVADIYRFQTPQNSVPALAPARNSDVAEIISDSYSAISSDNTYAKVQGVALSTTDRVVIYDETLNTADAPTFTSAMSGKYLVYKLANPTPIQLSPTMVKALVGENHLSAPLEGQEITESVYSPLAKWNAVIDDTTASDDTTYSSNKINAIVPRIDDNTTSASKVFSSLKTAALITELSERFDFSTTEKPLGWWTDGKVYYGKVINIMGCPKEMFGLMVDLGVEVDTFIGIFAVGNAKDDNYNGGYCMGGTIYCKVIKSEGQNTQIQPACAVMALSGASLLVLYTKVE